MLKFANSEKATKLVRLLKIIVTFPESLNFIKSIFKLCVVSHVESTRDTTHNLKIDLLSVDNPDLNQTQIQQLSFAGLMF